MSNARPVAAVICLILVLLLLIPPNGILSDNEENYFALAQRFIDGSAWPEKTAVFDKSRHLTLSNTTLGLLVSAIGYAPAQVVTRLLAVGGYAIALTALFGVFGLSALDAALAVMGAALIGQDIVGGEWLFNGYEAKVAAYILVLAAMRRVLICQRLTGAILLFAAATYAHFLVGGFWFLATMALRLVGTPRDVRRVAAATAMYALLIMPLLGVIAWSRIAAPGGWSHIAAPGGWSHIAETGAAGATEIAVPTPDVIYSIIREPHHQSPFLSAAYFHDRWLPGYLMAAPMLLTCLWVAWREKEQQLRVLARWLAGLLAYLVLVLGPKFLDRDSGILGKFYLFRPSALILLLWLLLAAAVAAANLGNRTWIARASLLILIGPMFWCTQCGQLLRTSADNASRERPKRLLIDAVARIVTPGQVVLIDPDEEGQLLDFERRTGLPTLVMWKFAPTNDAELVLWYRREELRRLVFEQGCGGGLDTTEIDYLLTTPAKAPRLAASCGPAVWRADQWVLLHRGR